MAHHSPITVPAPTHWVECDDCEGKGKCDYPITYAGEAYGELVEGAACQSCDGEGGWFEDDDDLALAPVTRLSPSQVAA